MSSRDAERAAHYFQDAALLRWCLELNRSDFEIANSRGRIVYIMDANVVRFFISPEEETRHVMPFRSQQRLDFAAATALITAEFLFSRGLAGQDYGPAFITPPHGEEIGDIIGSMGRAATQRPKTEGVEEDWSEQIRAAREVVKRFRDGRLNRVEAAEELKQRVPQVAALLMEGEFQWAVQLRRLYEEDLLRPLALHTEATQDILDPPKKLVEDWAKLIASERKPRTERDRKKVYRDAQGLVQVILLDRQAQSEPDLMRRYVLVTADHALLDAYTKWFWGPDRPLEDRFILRIPQQYSPILNSYEMPNNIESAQVTRRAFAALDSLFDNLQRADPQYVQRLPFYRLIAREPGELQHKYEDLYGFNPFAIGSPKAFDHARELWDDSFRGGVVLNARLMNKRTTEFEFLETLLRDDVNLREEIYQHQARSLERIEAAHTAYATRLNLRVLREGKGFAAPQRAYPALRARFATLSDISITEVLEGIAGSDEDLLARVDKLLSRDDGEAYFLAACIAHRCGHWSAAGIYAARTLELLKLEPGPDDVLGDISFLHASSIRYALASSPTGDEGRLAEVGRALELLEEAEKTCDAKGDAFGRARAISERCALQMMRLYYRWLSGFASPDEEIAQLASAHHDLAIAEKLITEVRNLDDSEPLRRLVRQRISNMISGWVYAHMLAPDGREAHALAAIASQDPGLLVAELKSGGAAQSLIMEAECLMVMLGTGLCSPAEAVMGLELIAGRGHATDALLEMDRLELARFADVAAQFTAPIE